MTGAREFRAVTRRPATGTFSDDRLELAQGDPCDATWFPCGVYTIGGDDIVVVNEPTTILQHAAVSSITTPSWATALIDATLLSPEGAHPPRIEIDVVHPADLDPAAAAFAAVGAAWDDGFHDDHPVDALVRIRHEVLRVRAAYEPVTGTWSGVASEATATERTEMARWRLYRSVNTRRGWGGWNAEGFHFSTDSPYDVAYQVPYSVVPLDGLTVAVVTAPLTPVQSGQLLRTAPPAWIDVVALSRLMTTPDDVNARIAVDQLRPHHADPTLVGVAVAAAHELGGRFDVELDDCAVLVGDDEIHVVLCSDTDADGHTWTAHAGPLRR